MEKFSKSIWAENSLPKKIFNRCFAAVKKLYPDLQKYINFNNDLICNRSSKSCGMSTYYCITRQAEISFSAKNNNGDPNYVLSVLIHEFAHIISFYTNAKYKNFDKKHPDRLADDGHNATFRKYCAILVDKICTNDEKTDFYLYACDGPVSLYDLNLYFDKDNDSIGDLSNGKLKINDQQLGDLKIALEKYPDQTIRWINNEENSQMKKSDGKYYYKQPFAIIF